MPLNDISALNITEKKITISGNSICYACFGNVDKPKLVMVHGFRGTYQGLLDIAKLLSNDFYIIMPDLPGFGDSTYNNFMQNKPSVEFYAKILSEFIDAVAKGAYIAAHSFGTIVVSYALDNIDSKGVILINPIINKMTSFPRGLVVAFTTLYYKAASLFSEKVFRFFVASRFAVFICSRVMQKTKNKVLKKKIDQEHYKYFSFFDSASSLLNAYDASIYYCVKDRQKSYINKKTLILYGNKDVFCTKKDILSFAPFLQNAQVKEYNNVGHLIHYEAYNKAAVDILKFIYYY